MNTTLLSLFALFGCISPDLDLGTAALIIPPNVFLLAAGPF